MQQAQRNEPEKFYTAMIVYGCRPFNYGDDPFVRATTNGLVINHKSLIEVNIFSLGIISMIPSVLYISIYQ